MLLLSSFVSVSASASSFSHLDKIIGIMHSVRDIKESKSLFSTSVGGWYASSIIFVTSGTQLINFAPQETVTFARNSMSHNKQKAKDALDQLGDVKKKRTKRTEQYAEELDEDDEKYSQQPDTSMIYLNTLVTQTEKRGRNDGQEITKFFPKKTDADDNVSSPPQKRLRPEISESLERLAPNRSMFDPDAQTAPTIVDKAEVPAFPELETSSDIVNFKSERHSDGSLLMYWLDATEIQGQIYLFGKVKEHKSDKFISCCVMIPKLWRQCYLLLPDDDMEHSEIVDQVAKFAKSNSISGAHKFKVVTKQYCFEEAGIPYGEHKYVEFLYPLWEGDVCHNSNYLTFARTRTNVSH
jgi:hypothetical protein